PCEGALCLWVRGAPPLPWRAARGAECERARHFGYPRLGFHPRLRLGQPPPRCREGYRIYGGDGGTAVLGPLGQIRNAASIGGAALRGRRENGPARQLLCRKGGAGSDTAQALSRRAGSEPP